MEFPKITIITPSFNQAQYLEETIRSVLDQKYPNLEYFVVDGGSTDNSVEIIRRYSDRITWWVSEKDKGQTDAINKGLTRATGEIVNWINSDDLLAPGSLQHIATKFQDANVTALCGPIEMFDGERRWKFKAAYIKGESFASTFGIDIYNQPGTFFRRRAILRMGLPDVTLNYVMDKEWFMRYLVHFGIDGIATTDQILAEYRVHQTTKTAGQTDKFMNEYAMLTSRWAAAFGADGAANLVAQKYDVRTHPYRVPSGIASDNLPVAVLQMTALLLLRRFNRIYNEADYDFAGKMNVAIDWSKVTLDESLKSDLTRMQRNLSWGGWTFFRVRRKLGLAGQY